MPSPDPAVHMTGTQYVQSLYGTPSPFPPSFEGNPLSYAFGLFGDTVAAALALTILLNYILEGRRFRRIAKMLGSTWTKVDHPDPWTPLWLYRVGQQMFLTFVVMRTLPDALWMLAWGEVKLHTIEWLLRLDMVMDGMSVVPLFIAAAVWAHGRQVIPQKLMEGRSSPLKERAPWDIILKNIKIVGAVIAISLLVTIGKASG